MHRLCVRPAHLLALALAVILAGLAVLPSPGRPEVSTAEAAPSQEVWFAPYPYGMVGAPWQASFGSVDFKNLFTPRASWATASSRTGVFQFYQNWLLNVSAADLRTEVRDLARRGMRIAVESSALTPDATCGLGVEGFQPDPAANTLKALKNVKDATGAVALVVLAEPVSFGTAYDGPNACRWTPIEVASRVATYVAAVRAVYPSVKFGSTEADWTPVASVAAFADAFAAATGGPLAFIHWDADWQRRTDWPQRARSMETEAENRGIPFGMIYFGNPDDTLDVAWLQHAAEHMAVYETLGQGSPSHAVFQSWHKFPQRTMPDASTSSFANLIVRYFNPRTALTLGLSGSTATGVLKKQNQFLGYRAFSSQTVNVSIKPLDGPGRYYEYTIIGTVPPDATGAALGVRMNIECGCNGVGEFSLYEARYQESNGANKVPNPVFSDGLNSWGTFGDIAITTAPSDRGAGTMLRASVGPSQAGGLNSTVFAVSPGKTYQVTFSANVAPSSIGSGYFAVMFAVASGERRPTVPLEAPLTTVKATTNGFGNYSAALPAPLPPAYELTASYAGTPAIWAAYARQLAGGPAVVASATAAPSEGMTLDCRLPGAEDSGDARGRAATLCRPPR